jgi:hypothetical protein
LVDKGRVEQTADNQELTANRKSLSVPFCRLDPLRGAARQGKNLSWLRTLTGCAPGHKGGGRGIFLCEESVDLMTGGMV